LVETRERCAAGGAGIPASVAKDADDSRLTLANGWWIQITDDGAGVCQSRVAIGSLALACWTRRRIRYARARAVAPGIIGLVGGGIHAAGNQAGGEKGRANAWDISIAATRVNSSTYRQSSRVTPELYENDQLQSITGPGCTVSSGRRDCSGHHAGSFGLLDDKLVDPA